jgi:iron transport multicopper oxidase
MIEAPFDVQKMITIPDDHLQVCKDVNSPVAGNAAGNTEDLFDLSGENTAPGPLPAGFTARGVVALVFSCLSAFLGMAVIVW